MKTSGPQHGRSATGLIEAPLAEIGDRGRMLSRLWTLARRTDPDVVEAWRGVTLRSHDGPIRRGAADKSIEKTTFAKSAALKGPRFHSSREGATRRAAAFHVGETMNETALKALVGDAVTLDSPKPGR